MSTPQPPPRVRVTAPRSVRGRRRTPRTAVPDIDAQSEIGEIFVRSLLRTQLRVALGTVGLLVLCVGSLPLLFRWAPDIAGTRVAEMPLAWVVLAFPLYPVMVLIGWRHVRRAERVERAFTDVVEGS